MQSLAFGAFCVGCVLVWTSPASGTIRGVGLANASVADRPLDRGRPKVSSRSGGEIYASYCSQCHQPDGLGVAGRFPPIIGSEWVTGPPVPLLRILLDGLEGPVWVQGKEFNGVMPGARNDLVDQELAAVATFIRRWKLNSTGSVSPAMVGAVRASTRDRARRWTSAELYPSRGGWVFWTAGAAIGLIGLIFAIAATRTAFRRRA